MDLELGSRTVVDITQFDDNMDKSMDGLNTGVNNYGTNKIK
jgi:hypothetical protein